MKAGCFLALVCLLGCESTGGRARVIVDAGPGLGDLGGTAGDLRSPSTADGSLPPGCPGVPGCYTVYAHSDHELYHVDLSSKKLVPIGAFRAPKVGGVEDVITDLAVAPDDTIFVISRTNLYQADPGDGHVTLVGPITNCGNFGVALTFTPDGNLYSADYSGAFCRIDWTVTPPKVSLVGMLGGGLAVAGDLVAVADGTMFATAYKPADTSTNSNNYLVTIDPATGAVTQTLGQTGFPTLFGVAFELGQVFGFTHDGSGDVITIDPKTGKGTLYNRFKDPTTGKGIPFAGAGVNSMVAPPIM
jgi:hypothetical protein